MLEQATLHGRIFHSIQKGKTIASKPVPVSSIRFGPMRPIQIYPVSDTDMWVENKTNGDFYHYIGNYGDLDLKLDRIYAKDEFLNTKDRKIEGFFYYYGKASFGEKQEQESTHPYFVQNVPQVTYEEIPDTEMMQMPLTLQALNYEQIFAYPKEIKELLKDLPACYVDRFKRPIKRCRNRTYPIPMETVTTTWKDLKETTYPVVLNLKNTKFAVADLEPDHTKEDLDHFHTLPGFYEEETPRGGKHKVVCIEDETYKFRYSKGLEIINESQVTLYGINAKWLGSNPKPLDISKYQTIGHKERSVTNVALERPDVKRETTLLKKKAEENLSTAIEIAEKLYQTDIDDSHGEFMVLKTVYEADIAPYANQLDSKLLPWIVEEYAKEVICHRQKHETMRHGLPYLVYLAAIIIEKKEVSLIWEDIENNQNCISFEPGR